MQLYYREIGKGQPLILLHGLWGASENWLPVARKLSDRFRVILPDLRNHGRSGHQSCHDYPALREDIHELMDTLGLTEKPVLAGHSMGGKTVMAFLLQYPEAVSRGIVIDIAPISYPLSEEHRTFLQLIRTLTPQTIPGRDQLLAKLKQWVPDTETQQLVLKNIRRSGKSWEWKINTEALEQNIKAICSWPEQWQGQKYTSPVLFIKGENSPYIPDDECMKKQFPAAHIEIIPGTTHRIHAEQPDLLAACIRREAERKAKEPLE